MKNKLTSILAGIALLAVAVFIGLRERLAPLPKFNIINETSLPCIVETSETAFAVNPLRFEIRSGSSQVVTPWPMSDYFHSELLLTINCGSNNKLSLRMDVPAAKNIARTTNGPITLSATEDGGFTFGVNLVGGN